MLGTKDHRELKLKAAETKGLLPFVVHTLQTKGAAIRQEAREPLTLAARR